MGPAGVSKGDEATLCRPCHWPGDATATLPVSAKCIGWMLNTSSGASKVKVCVGGNSAPARSMQHRTEHALLDPSVVCLQSLWRLSPLASLKPLVVTSVPLLEDVPLITSLNPKRPAQGTAVAFWRRAGPSRCRSSNCRWLVGSSGCWHEPGPGSTSRQT